MGLKKWESAMGVCAYRLSHRHSFAPDRHTHPREWSKRSIGQHVDSLYSKLTWSFSNLKKMPSAVARTRWFVFRLSICFRNSIDHKSLHRNLITSRLSLKRGRSRANLHGIETIDVYQHRFSKPERSPPPPLLW